MMKIAETKTGREDDNEEGSKEAKEWTKGVKDGWMEGVIEQGRQREG